MYELMNKLKENTKIEIQGEPCVVKSKTWYSLEEDETASYIKCNLSNHKCLVIVPDDDLIYLVEDENKPYEIISDDMIKYQDRIYTKVGEGHQFVTKQEFGNEEEIEGRCIFEDYQSDNYLISLGVLPDKENSKADIFGRILNLEDIKII